MLANRLSRKFIDLVGNRSFSSKVNVEEIKIPVPWGYISGKWWNRQDKRPILAVHGWQDNCGTFDTLAPNLAPDIGVLGIDLPGHGRSSPKPPGEFYHGIEYVLLMRRIMLYFNWNKLSLMGHSMGGGLALMFSILHPQTLDFLIMLDPIRPVIFKTSIIDTIAKTCDYFLKLDHINATSSTPPSYTYEELLETFYKGAWMSIDKAACKYILDRNIAPTKEMNKFYLTRDIRIKTGMNLLGVPEEFVLEGSRRVTMPTFASKSTSRENIPFESMITGNEVYDVLKDANRDFVLHPIPQTTHHGHLNNPEKFVGLLNEFIKKHDKAERNVGRAKNL